MKYLTLFFALISATALGQNELSMNNNANAGLTNNDNPVNIQENNSDAVQTNIGNEINIDQQVQINANINNVDHQFNPINYVQQKDEGSVQIQIGSRSHSSPSVSYSSSGSGHKKHSVVKDISKSIKAFQYKHSGKKKFRRHSGKHSRGKILRCFN